MSLYTNVSSEVVVAAVIFVFLFFAFAFFVYLYTRHYWPSSSTRGARASFLFARPAHDIGPPIPRRCLDTAVLRALPVTLFRSADFKEGLECSVCLSELSDGEEARLLPKCNHGFHLKCIDMWFQTHSTCPLCRSPVVTGTYPPPPGPDQSYSSANTSAAEYSSPSVLPITMPPPPSSSSISIGSSSGKPVVIEIPRGMTEGIISPSTRLTRLLSWGRRTTTAGSSSSPRQDDREEVVVVVSPKAPTS